MRSPACGAPLAALALITACNAISVPPTVPMSAPSGTARNAHKLKTPALIAYDNTNEQLVSWPLSPRGGTHMTVLSRSLGLKSVTGMVGNGHTVTLANYSPAELVSYNVDTGATSTLVDPYGKPVDVAIDKHATLYGLDDDNVFVQPSGSSPAYELTCAYMTQSIAIAVDNEGDVFVNGYGPGSFIGVVEYPTGSKSCLQLALKRKEVTYVTGLGIDPNSDDLLVEDNPQACAGGWEGVITVYARPYGPRVVAHHNLHANCPGPFRLDATSSTLLFTDTLPELRANGFPRKLCESDCIDQRSYPDFKVERFYTGGYPNAITTIPNRLPN
jgi:hypothetical protein